MVPTPPPKKLVQIKSLSLRSFQGANCVLTCCVLNHCLGLWSPMSQTHPGITEPKGNCTSARVMGYPGNTTEKPDTSDTTSWGYAPCFKRRIPNSLLNFMWLSAFHSLTHTHTHSMQKKITSNQENALRPTFEKKSHYITPGKARLVLLIQDRSWTPS